MGGGLSSCGSKRPAPVVPKPTDDSFSEDIVQPLSKDTVQSNSLSAGPVHPPHPRRPSLSLSTSVASHATPHTTTAVVAFGEKTGSSRPPSSVVEKKNLLFRKSANTKADTGCQTDRMQTDSVRDSGPQMPSRWKKGESIGSGSFGTVFLGLNSDTGELLAVKEVAVMVGDSRNKEAVEQLEREVLLLSMLHHPNIVRYVGTCREGATLFIFLEYVPGGSIASLLTRFGPLEESVIKIYTRQLVAGLAYLHAQRTVHRDIKGANLLVEKNGRVKLADFGMAKQMVEQVSFTKSFKGSAFWMAPEVIKQQGHGVAADIWSVGCTVLEMATGRPPWSQCSTQVQAIFKIASSQELPAIPETLSPEASEFILLCLQRDPAARPSAEELLKHPFVNAGIQGDVPALRGIDGGLGLAFRSPLPRQDVMMMAGGLPGAASSSKPSTPQAPGGGTLEGGTPGPGGRAASAAAPLTDDEVTENLAALVLGSSLHINKHKTSFDPAASKEDSPDDVVDFTTQPSQFRVRGLLVLPPLKMLQGQAMPAVQAAQIYRPSATGGAMSLSVAGSGAGSSLRFP